MMARLNRRTGLAPMLLLATCTVSLPSGCKPSANDGPAAAHQSNPTSLSATAQTEKTPAAPPAGTLPQYEIMGGDRGLAFERFDDIGGKHRIIEANGGGVALLDYDRDNWPDVLFIDGCPVPEGLTDPRYQSMLFRNRAGERFFAVTEPAGLRQHGYSCGCAVGDFDADGFDDIYITAFGQNALWKNNGDGTFSDVTEKTGTAVSDWSTSAAFGDVDCDGHLDLFVVNYLEESADSPRLCPNPKSPTGFVSCSPAVFDGVNDVLFLSDGAGQFSDGAERYGLHERTGKGLGVVISNLTGDLRPEIYVANDGEPNFLWVAESLPMGDADDRSGSPAPRWRYVDRALASGTALNEVGFAQASMGVAAGDYNSDGKTDLFLTHFLNETNTLYANRGELLFEDVTRVSQLAGSSLRMLGFGTMFLDAENDGTLDLFVANGYVEDLTGLDEGIPYRMLPQLYRNSGKGTFEDVSIWCGDYFEREWIGRGAASGDVNRDRRIDLAVSHQLGPSLVLRNETPTENNAIVLQLAGTRSNRNGFGARVELTAADSTIVRELTPGISFQSACMPELHLGLGTTTHGELRVTWPSGRRDVFPDVPPGHFVAVEGGNLYSIR